MPARRTCPPGEAGPHRDRSWASCFLYSPRLPRGRTPRRRRDSTLDLRNEGGVIASDGEEVVLKAHGRVFATLSPVEQLARELRGAPTPALCQVAPLGLIHKVESDLRRHERVEGAVQTPEESV